MANAVEKFNQTSADEEESDLEDGSSADLKEKASSSVIELGIAALRRCAAKKLQLAIRDDLKEKSLNKLLQN